jgi:Bacterial type II and III secretion system protein/FG-GAP-like repeat
MCECRHSRVIFLAALLGAVCLAPAWPQEPTAVPATQAATAPKGDPKKARDAFRLGQRAEQKEDWQPAFDAYSDAVKWAPDNQEYLLHRELARSRLVQMKMDLAEREAVSGNIEDSMREVISAQALDPSSRVLRERFAQLAAVQASKTAPVLPEPATMAGVQLERLPGTRNFNYRGDVAGAYKEIARQFGVEVAFDVDVEQKRQNIRFEMPDLDFPTAMRVLAEMTGTFWRPLTKRLFLVAMDTPQKRKDYELSVVRTVVLPAAVTQEEMTELMRLVREITGITRVQLDSRTGTLTLRASPQAITVATQLIEDLQKPVGELILEIEILEVDRTFSRLLGVTPPETARVISINQQEVNQALASTQGLVQVLQEVFGTPSSLSGLTTSQITSLLSSGNVNVSSFIPPLLAFGGGASTFLYMLPGTAINFSEMLSLVRHGRRILLRVEDGKPATFFVGDRVPVTLAQFSPSLEGQGASIQGVASTNFPVTTLPTGTSPEYVTTADLRGKSIQDLIVANTVSGDLTVFLGNGDGTFATGTTIPLGLPTTATAAPAPVWVATGPFNTPSVAGGPGDTFVDLAVVDSANNLVSILLGDGTGAFPKNATALQTGVHPVSIVATKLTTSGFTDLVVVNQTDNTLSVFLGQGDGNFKATPTVATGHFPTSVAAGDFNGDGNMDLVVTNGTDNTITILLGDGKGHFTPSVQSPIAVGESPAFVATADLNGDGILDLAVANNGAGTTALSGNTVAILLGVANPANTSIGNGTFQSPAFFAAGNGPKSISVADVNIDGIPDLVVADQNDNAISLLLGLGGGQYGPNVELTVGTDPVSVVTADFTGENKPDAAVANEGSNSVSVILNSSTFGSANPLAQTPFPGVQYLDVGVKVKATPRVHPEGEVTVHLQFEISSLTAQAFNGIPVISNQSIDQFVRVKQDETTAIAGILQPQQMYTISGTPGIADLPGIGFLGGTRNTQLQDTELLILVTPRTVALSPRKDHVIYAGRGALEGGAAFIPSRQTRENEQQFRQPNVPPTVTPPPQQPPQQQPVQPPPQPAPPQ